MTTDADDAITTAKAAIRRLERHLLAPKRDREERDAAIARALRNGMTPGQVARALHPDISETYVRRVQELNAAAQK